MKWLFLTLLLVNMGVFIWFFPQEMSRDQHEVVEPGIKRLALVSEMGNNEVNKDDAIDPASRSMPIQVVAGQLNESEQSEIVQSDNSEKSISAEPELRQVQSEGQPQVVAAYQSENKTESELGSVITEKSDQEVESKIEVEPAKSVEQPKDTSSQESSEQDLAQVLQCERLGPLEKRADADILSLRLRNIGLKSDIQSESISSHEGYWVLIPQQQSKQEAIEEMERLKKAGVTDLWRFTSGDLTNAISLGLFRNESRALWRKRQLEEKGFRVEVAPRYLQKTRYWLDISYLGASPVSDSFWKDVTGLFPDLVHNEIDCLEIATN